MPDYRCIVITSRYGADIFIDSLKRYNIDVRTLHGIQLAVIGSGTAETFRRNGIFPDIIPDRYDSAGLAAAITQTIAKEDRILILNSEISSGELTAYLDNKGFEYDTVKIYDTQAVPSDIKIVDDDYIVFGSSSRNSSSSEISSSSSSRSSSIFVMITLIRSFFSP